MEQSLTKGGTSSPHNLVTLHNPVDEKTTATSKNNKVFLLDTDVQLRFSKSSYL